jgi:hypothetical protein
MDVLMAPLQCERPLKCCLLLTVGDLVGVVGTDDPLEPSHQLLQHTMKRSDVTVLCRDPSLAGDCVGVMLGSWCSGDVLCDLEGVTWLLCAGAHLIASAETLPAFSCP